MSGGLKVEGGGERLRIVFGLFFSGEGFSECTHSIYAANVVPPPLRRIHRSTPADHHTTHFFHLLRGLSIGYVLNG